MIVRQDSQRTVHGGQHCIASPPLLALGVGAAGAHPQFFPRAADRALRLTFTATRTSQVLKALCWRKRPTVYSSALCRVRGAVDVGRRYKRDIPLLDGAALIPKRPTVACCDVE